jgi:anti-anti-sigma factor
MWSERWACEMVLRHLVSRGKINSGPIIRPSAAVPAQRSESPGRLGEAPITAIRESGTRVTVKVVGDLDRTGVAKLRSELTAWREAGVGELRLNLSEMTFWEAGLARVLARARQQLRASGGHLIITGVRPHLYVELDRVSHPRGVGEPIAGG